MKPKVDREAHDVSRPESTLPYSIAPAVVNAWRRSTGRAVRELPRVRSIRA